MQRRKNYLNYDLVIDSDNPSKARLIKYTKNPEYVLSVDFEVVKVGVFRFVKI